MRFLTSITLILVGQLLFAQRTGSQSTFVPSATTQWVNTHDVFVNVPKLFLQGIEGKVAISRDTLYDLNITCVGPATVTTSLRGFNYAKQAQVTYSARFSLRDVDTTFSTFEDDHVEFVVISGRKLIGTSLHVCCDTLNQPFDEKREIDAAEFKFYGKDAAQMVKALRELVVLAQR